MPFPSTGRAAHGRFRIPVFPSGDLARAVVLVESENVGSGTKLTSLKAPIEHRSARHQNGRHVAACGTQQQRRRGLIASRPGW